MKRALLTGANGGLGKELATKLIEKGVSVLITGRDEQALQKLQNQVAKKGRIEYFVCDLSKPADCLALEKMIEKDSFDLIINNAGFGLYGETTLLPLDQQLAMVEVNSKAVLRISVAGARKMVSLGQGVIMNISSVAGFMPMPLMSVYGATKAFVTSFSEALDYELRPKGVCVLASCPGRIATGFSDKASQKYATPESKRMTPEEAAEEILWQITNKKGVHVFDKKTAWMLRMTKIFPRSWQKKAIYKSIKNKVNPGL